MMVEVSSTPLTVTSTRPTGDAADLRHLRACDRVAGQRVEFALTQVDLTLPQYRVLGILFEGSAAASGWPDVWRCDRRP